MQFINVSQQKKDRYVIKKPGKHILFLHNYSGKVEVEIKSENCEVFIYGVYIGKNNDNFQLNTIQKHTVGNSISDLFIKGVFFDQSKFVYEGLIRIEKNAQKSNAYQKNQNLIMSKGCFIDSRPFLEILANDVRCTHGSTTGKLNEEQLYYLETRGISKNQAQRLLIEGFINDIFLRMQSIGFSENLSALKKQTLRLIN